MTRATNSRLRRLEGAATATGSEPIAVWCFEHEDFDSAVAGMVAGGEIAEGDRARCVPWWEWRGHVLDGGPEARLEFLK